MLLGSVASFLLLAAILLFAGYLPLLAMAQQIAVTTTPPLTPEEQEQQNRLQNTIAATTRNLEQGQKEVNGVVFTPRWSNPVWVEADSLSILFVYCLPGEFAESGQEILGGFELEVLESYEIALPQGFMAWMMVIGNEDRQNRLPAAVGVICTSDTNDVETRVLSAQEQQQINNVVQQFTTQVTNIEQVVNIINNITTPQNETGGGITPPPPTNDTGTTTEEQPLTVDIITDATQAYTGATIRFDASITGGAPPYSYTWYVPGFGAIDQDRSITQMFFEPGTFTYILTATDSNGQTASDSVQIHIRERPQGGGLLGEGVLDNATVAGEGVPLTVNIITNATQAVAPATIRFDASITGGAPPYSYVWSSGVGVIDRNRSITQTFSEPGYFVYYLYATDRTERTWSDVVTIVILEAEGVLPPPETGQEGQPPGGGLLPGIAPREEEQQEQPQVPPPTVQEDEEEVASPPAEEPPAEEEQQPPTATGGDEGGAVASPPANGEGEG